MEDEGTVTKGEKRGKLYACFRRGTKIRDVIKERERGLKNSMKITKEKKIRR
jgi:hypothetical protein